MAHLAANLTHLTPAQVIAGVNNSKTGISTGLTFGVTSTTVSTPGSGVAAVGKTSGAPVASVITPAGASAIKRLVNLK